ncbi:hypothetical protein KPATCC21470_1607 [Kitasatospora purpeofusca]
MRAGLCENGKTALSLLPVRTATAGTGRPRGTGSGAVAQDGTAPCGTHRRAVPAPAHHRRPVRAATARDSHAPAGPGTAESSHGPNGAPRTRADVRT